MQLDAPETASGSANDTDAEQAPDLAHRHLEALLADAAQLAEDENLDDRTWAELIVRMVYSTSALRQLAGKSADVDLTAPPAEQPTGDAPAGLELPPPAAGTLVAAEAPPDLDLSPPPPPPKVAGEHPASESPPDVDLTAVPMTSPAAPPVDDELSLAAAPLFDASSLPDAPYIPERRWRPRRGRHRVERHTDYDYFQDLRRVLDELETAERARVGAGPAPAPQPAEPSPEPSAAFEAPAAEAFQTTPVVTTTPSAEPPLVPSLPQEEAAADESREPVVEVDSPPPAPAPAPPEARREVAGPPPPGLPVDDGDPPTVAPMSPPAVRDLVATGPVPFDELSRGLAALHVEESAPSPGSSATCLVPFHELSRRLATLDAAPPDASSRFPEALDSGTPAAVAADDAPSADAADATQPSPPAEQGGAATVHRSDAANPGPPAAWAEHMLLGALVVVAARRPARWFLRVLSSD